MGEVEPSESLEALELFPQQPLLYLFAGLSHFQLQEFTQAMDFFTTGQKFVINNKALMMQFYSYIGDTHHELGDHAKSDENYIKALELDSVNSVVLNNYAYYLSERNDKLELADEMSKKATELDSANSSNLDTRAWVLYKLNRFEEAFEYIKQALEYDSSSAVLLEHYGDISYKLGQTETALEYWKKAQEKGEGSSFLEQKIREGKLYE